MLLMPLICSLKLKGNEAEMENGKLSLIKRYAMITSRAGMAGVSVPALTVRANKRRNLSLTPPSQNAT